MATLRTSVGRNITSTLPRMPSRFPALAVAVALTSPWLAAPVAAQSGARPSARDFAAERLAATPTASWPTNGGNLYNQRYSPLARIDRSNVAQLKGVWRARLNGSGVGSQYSGEAQPVVYDGAAYVSTGADDVFAISLDSGEILWRYSAKLDPGITSVCCGWTSRGVAVSADKVFVGRLDARLVALDRKTGEPVWDVPAERWEDNFSITAAPLYYDGMVIVGFAGADRGTRGRVKAFDAKDGRSLWTFYTIPGPGEVGHETWPQDNDAWKYGGASVWQTPAVDPELGLIYFSTGNAGPDYNGSVRAGDNLFSVSIVAIEARTGKYRWHFQQVHHDLWDYDSSNPVVLMDLDVGGRPRKAVVEVGKTGFAYILDRATGEPIVGIDEKPVPQDPRQATAATQPFPRGEAVVPQEIAIPPEGTDLVSGGRIFTPFFGDAGVLVKPGIWGGANWPPSSYDPKQQTLFVCASSVVGNYKGGDRDFGPPAQGKPYNGGGGGGYTSLPRTGIFAAVDMTTNTMRWRYRWPDQCYSGSLATGGGLVFVGRADGRLTAVDSSTGQQLWEFQTGAGMHAGASTFERGGKQYVIAYSGGNALIGSGRGDSVWLFALDGTLPEAAPYSGPRQTYVVPPTPTELPVATTAPAVAAVSPTTAPAPAAAAPVGTAAGNAANGKTVYAETCLICHGEDGLGGHGGGAPLDQVASAAAAMQTLEAGRNNMPSFAGVLTAEQIRDVAAYVVERLHAPPSGAR
jgi:alcohol dehydrogenase (cytochrome c)